VLVQQAVVVDAVLVDVDRPGVAGIAQRVAVGAPVQDVRAVVGDQRVVAALAAENVLPGATLERVGAGAAGDLIDPVAAVEGVVADLAV